MAENDTSQNPEISSKIIERSVQIKNKMGIHARPAAMLVQMAGKYSSEISIIKDDIKVDGKSIMGVMMLAAEYGSTIIIQAEGEDAEEVVEKLVDIVESKFNEE
jgi:phosphocarrier protein